MTADTSQVREVWKRHDIKIENLQNEIMQLESFEALSPTFMSAWAILLEGQFRNFKCQVYQRHPEDLVNMSQLGSGEVAIYFHQTTLDGKPSWQCSIRGATGSLYLLDAHQGSFHPFIGSRVESEIVKVIGFTSCAQLLLGL